MIKIVRLPKPLILQEKAAQWTDGLCHARQEYYQELEAFEQGNSPVKPKRPRARRERYGHQEVKECLQSMFGDKCAYCESRVKAVSHQHVEHFRPQSIYPRLAYEWANLLLACAICNSDYRRDQFPLVDGNQPVEDRNDPCLLDDSDDNALVNPCLDEPEDFFEFEDEWIVPRNIRAKYTRDVCGLNREALKDQRRDRLAMVELIAKAFLYFDQNNMEERRTDCAERLRSCLSQSAPYSAMVRAKLEVLGIDTAHLCQPL